MSPHNISIEADEHGKDTKVAIDGHALRRVRRVEIVSEATEATLVRLEILCTVNKPDPSHWIHADRIVNFMNNDERLSGALRASIGENGIDPSKFRETMLAELKLEELIIEDSE